MRFENLRSPEWIESQRRYFRSVGTLDIVFFFSCMGDRLWSYAIGYFIASLGGLTWVGLGQLIDSFVKLVSLPIVGGLLDKVGRHKGMQIVLACNNLSIVFSSIAFYLSLTKYFDNESINSAFFWVAIVFNALSRVASEAQKTAFLKDWLVVIVQDFEEGQLSTHNAICTAIDQGGAFAAPFVCGAALTYLGHPNSAILFCGWNLISWIIEALVMRNLFQRTPSLHTRANSEREPSCCSAFSGDAYCVWWSQPCWRAMFSLSLLFFTVLGFDNIITAYGTAIQLSPMVMSFYRGIGAAFGCFGAGTYSIMNKKRYSVVFIGLIGLFLQNVTLNLTTVSIFLPGNQYDAMGYWNNVTWTDWFESAHQSITNPQKQTDGSRGFSWLFFESPSLFFFFAGVTLARYGLWIADPSVQQIMQESVPEDQRYRVGLAQNATQEIFSFLKDLLVVAFPLAATFGALITVSVTFVLAGFLLYITYYITEGRPIKRRATLQAENIEMVPRLEFNVTERGVHPELEGLLRNGNLENGAVEKAAPLESDVGDNDVNDEKANGEAPIQTTRTEGL